MKQRFCQHCGHRLTSGSVYTKRYAGKNGYARQPVDDELWGVEEAIGIATFFTFFDSIDEATDFMDDSIAKDVNEALKDDPNQDGEELMETFSSNYSVRPYVAKKPVSIKMGKTYNGSGREFDLIWRCIEIDNSPSHRY